MSNYILNTNDYVIRIVDNKYVFLRFSNGDSYILDDISTLFLNTFLNESDPIRFIGEYFNNIDIDILKNDFSDFINELLVKKLIVLKQ